MRRLKKFLIFTFICFILFPLFLYAKKAFFTHATNPIEPRYAQTLFLKQICTPDFKITPYLLSIFYDYKELADIENLPQCPVAADMHSKPIFKSFFPDEVFTNFYQKNCQRAGGNVIQINDGNKRFFLYQTPDQKKFCRSLKKCADIVLKTQDLLILQENKKENLEILRQVKPFVYQKAQEEIYPTLLDPTFQWDKFKNNLEMGFAPGGLGNHLFQYWTAKVYALKHHKKLYCQPPNKTDTTDIMEIFEFEGTMPTNAVVYSRQSPIIQAFYKNKTTGPAQTLNDKPDYVFIKGYLQSYKNFIGYENYIRKHTKFKQPLSAQNKKVIQTMSKNNAVAIHIRRGDYLFLNYHVLSSDYYKRAISYMNSHVKNPHYYIFSNDMRWAKENLNLKEPHTFVDWNRKDYEDLQLMMHCKHFIIANSTFSWWGAFLSQNPDKIVIVPDKWIPWASYWQEELILPNWIRQKND